MKILFDFLPIVAFFAVFKFYGIYAATGAAIFVTFIQVTYEWFSKKEVSKTLWINLALISILGGATILLKDETFIKWKPTALYALFAVILLGGEMIFKKNFLKVLLGEKMELEERLWKYMNHGWAIFFLVLSVLNVYVAYNFDTDTWVNFKLFGLLGLTFLFAITQSFLIVSFQTKEKEKADASDVGSKN